MDVVGQCMRDAGYHRIPLYRFDEELIARLTGRLYRLDQYKGGVEQLAEDFDGSVTREHFGTVIDVPMERKTRLRVVHSPRYHKENPGRLGVFAKGEVLSGTAAVVLKQLDRESTSVQLRMMEKTIDDIEDIKIICREA